MKVLSLFDGISCGMVALKRIGIRAERYDAFEIDKYAITVSKKNFSDIIHCGNVFDGDFQKFQGYDLLLGGSPCTYWSIAKKGRETTSDGMGFQLFMEYVRALKESQCRYFLYENNYSVHQNIKNEITKHLGVEPIMINSALVSAQNRKRCYWTNVPGVQQPVDRKVLLSDIIDNTPWEGSKYFLTENAIGCAIRSRYRESGCRSTKKSGGTFAAVEIRKDCKANCITTVTKDSMVMQPIRIGNIGSNAQAHRVYSVHGKSITLSANGGGQGGSTGLYKIDLPDGNYFVRKLSPIECERLQTLPDNYTAGASDTQRYKMLGNGWTVDVIAHILSHLKKF